MMHAIGPHHIKRKGTTMEGIARRDFVKAAIAAAGTTLAAATVATAQEAPAEQPTFVPGSYLGTGAGRGGQIEVEVVLSEHAIEAVNVVSHNETRIISDAPLTRIPQQVVKHQSVAVDMVSHATVSSAGVYAAICDALSSAGVDLGALSVPFEADPVVEPELVDARIAIVGGGCAGLAAAVRAARLGEPVVLFEQSAHLGGDAMFAEGWAYGAGTLMQKAAGIEDSGEAVWQFMLDNLDTESPVPYDAAFCERYHVNAGRTIDWLDQYVGCTFHNREVTYGTYGGDPSLPPRIYYFDGGWNLVYPLIKKVEQGVRDGLITVLYEHEVTRLLTNEEGAVCGVEAVDRAGQTHSYPFDAVLMSCGGYHYNANMVRQYLGSDIYSGGASTANGSGYALVEELGCEPVNMSGTGLLYAAGIPSSKGIRTIEHAVDTDYPGVIWVDATGNRLVNETASTQISHRACVMAQDNVLYMVFPASGRLAYRGIVQKNGWKDAPFSPNQSWEFFENLLQAGEYVFEADTPEELAQKMGVDPVAFRQTVETANAAARGEAEDALGRTDLPVLEGKLYGIKTVTYLLQSFGGVAKTADYQMLDANGSPVPGLYAAGEFAGMGLVTPPLKRTAYVGGIGVGGCPNMGRLAIESIIASLTGADTELTPYGFEGDPASYDVQTYQPGDMIRYDLVFA